LYTVLAVLCIASAISVSLPEDIKSLEDVEVAVEVGESVGMTAGLFEEFVKTHGKKYEAEEYGRRLGIFGDSLRFIKEWNSNPKNTFSVAINEFADMTGEEFAKGHLNDYLVEDEKAVEALQDGDLGESRSVGEASAAELRNGAMHVSSGKELPKEVDWVHTKSTGRVYKQGVCAACYTFATNEAIEAEYFIKTGKLMPELSDQEILSCSAKNFNNHGCHGGTMEKSYKYILHAQDNEGGMTLASDYGYEGNASPCKRNKFKKVDIKLAGYRKINKGNENDLMDAVAQRPVAVGFDAHHPAFKLYDSGVFDIDYCTTHLTHAMVVVGYGKSKDGKAYWKLKNSWGKNWGQEGYGMVKRGANMCGISNLASYPVLKEPSTWSFERRE